MPAPTKQGSISSANDDSVTEYNDSITEYINRSVSKTNGASFTSPPNGISQGQEETMHKTSSAFRALVTLHDLRDRAKEAADALQEKGVPERVRDGWKGARSALSARARNLFSHPDDVRCEHIPQKYSYMFRPKSRWELVLLGGTVCGIEFCYSAETAFVTPILLSLGLGIKFVTMMWCLSPLIGFFLTPVLGSLSDSCESRFGRRRPFILLLSAGILVGLVLVPNGHRIGLALGDTPNLQDPGRSHGGTTNDTNGDTISQDSTMINVQELPAHPLEAARYDLHADSRDAEVALPRNDMMFGGNSRSSNPSAFSLITKDMDSETDLSVTEKQNRGPPNQSISYSIHKRAASAPVTSHRESSTISLVPNGSNSAPPDKPTTSPFLHGADSAPPDKPTTSPVPNSADLVPPNKPATSPVPNHTDLVPPDKPTTSPVPNDADWAAPNVSSSSPYPGDTNWTTVLLRIQDNGVHGPRRPVPTRNATSSAHLQPWSIVFTVLGTVLLDFCSDACQSPSRTYLLDVSLPEDHTLGLSTFTLMAGFGGALGYLMGAVHWEDTFIGRSLGGQVNAVYMIVTVIFVACLMATLCSFPEMPLTVLKDPLALEEYRKRMKVGDYADQGDELGEPSKNTRTTYGTTADGSVTAPGDETPVKEVVVSSVETNGDVCRSSTSVDRIPSPLGGDQPTIKEYLRSIVRMPRSLRVLCLTNLLCWMSLVCYSLYFTDFVGEVVYGGDPQAAEDSRELRLYQDGVSFACWGMALYSISCSFYSFFIEQLVRRFGAKPVYIGGQLVYSVGMVIMAAARHPAVVILLSPTAGVMYSTLFTMPYLLVAHYHCMQKFRDDKNGGSTGGVRGIGTDIATVSSMVFLAQFILSLSMGSIVNLVGSKVATVCMASFLSACGALSATQVLYLDM